MDLSCCSAFQKSENFVRLCSPPNSFCVKSAIELLLSASEEIFNLCNCNLISFTNSPRNEMNGWLNNWIDISRQFSSNYISLQFNISTSQIVEPIFSLDSKKNSWYRTLWVEPKQFLVKPSCIKLSASWYWVPQDDDELRTSFRRPRTQQTNRYWRRWQFLLRKSIGTGQWSHRFTVASFCFGGFQFGSRERRYHGTQYTDIAAITDSRVTEATGSAQDRQDATYTR